MRFAALTLVPWLLALPAVASAQDADLDAPRANTGFQLALRAGIAVPAGNASGFDNDALSNSFGTQFPITIDIGGKPSPNWFIGGYFGYGLGGVGSELQSICSSGVSCSVSDLRVGFQVQYNISPRERVNPWIGYGIGYEVAKFSGSGNGRTASLSASGPEIGNFLFGVDFRVSPTIGIGPYVGLGVGEFVSETITKNGDSTDGSIDKKAFHEWLSLGARLVIFP